MEKNDKRNRKIDQRMMDLPAALQGAVLEKVRFGRSENTSYWVQGTRLREVCEFVKEQGEMDCLENLSCVQVDQNLLLTYFLRSTSTHETAILRVSLELPADYMEFVDMDSMSSVWESSRTFEREIHTLFGVRFGGDSGGKGATESLWDGFPLRKDFVLHGIEGLT